MPRRQGETSPSAAPPSAPAEPARALVLDLDWRSVVVAMAAFAALVLVTTVLRAAPRTITSIAIGGLLALAITPLVDSVDRLLPGRTRRRGMAVAVVLGGFIAAIAGLVVLLGPPAIRQARALQDDIPEVVADLGELPIIGDDLIRNDVPQRVEDWLQDLPERLGGDTAPIEAAARSILGGAVSGFAVVLVTVALLLDGERVIGAVRRIVPRRRRERADRIGALFYQVVGRYFAGSLLVAVVAGVFVLAVGLAFGVPLTPLLAVWVAVFDLVPQIGGAAGGIPFVALALTQGPLVGVAVGVLFVAYLQFENHILTPLIVGEAVDLSPPATMVAALIGVSVAGVPGALLAVPGLGVAKAVYLELRDPAEAERRARRRGRKRGQDQ